MTGININFPQNEYEYSYNQSSSTTNVNNVVNVYPKGDPNKDLFIKVSSKSKNMTSTGNMPYDMPKPKAGVGKKLWKGFKYAMGGVRPGQLLMLGMMGFVLLARVGGTSPSGNGGASKNATEQAYKMGEQHIRDSIKTAQLEEQLKLAQDSLKLLKKMPK